jgi:hypothetical protein
MSARPIGRGDPQAWADLLAGALSRRLDPTLVVLWQPQPRVWPLLSAAPAPVVGLRPQAPWWHELQQPGDERPSTRPVAADTDPVVHEWLARAGLGVAWLGGATAVDGLAAALTAAQRPWLLAAEAGDADAQACAARLGRSRAWIPLALHGLRLWADPALWPALQALGLPEADSVTPAALAARWLARGPAALRRRPPVTPASADPVGPQEGPPAPALQMLWRPAPLQALATTAESALHRGLTQGRALFGPRGTLALVPPWSGCTRLQLQISGIVERTEGTRLHLHGAVLRPVVRHTEAGAQLQFELPPCAGSGPLQLQLPRRVLDPQGHTELHALMFCTELA